MSELTPEDKAVRLQGRAFLYQMAHTVFGGEPDGSLFGVLASGDCAGTLRGMAEGGGDAVAALASFCEGLAGLGAEEREAVAQEALSTYNRCVAGLGADRESYPWESAYTSSKRLLFQVETLEVRNAYRAFGYLPELYPKVADDHIALECAFMAALAQKALAAEGDGLSRLIEGQRDFLKGHLLKWVDRYAADLREDAQGSLYALVAGALAEFARADFAFLESLDDE